MNRVIHFEIQADNIDRVSKFYQTVLGWKISKMMSKEQGGMDYWGIETGTGIGINGGLYQRPKKGQGDQFYLYDCTIEIADIDKAMKAVKANGGEIIKEKMEIPGVGLFAGAKDTEGNRFGLMQPTDWKPK